MCKSGVCYTLNKKEYKDHPDTGTLLYVLGS